MSKLKSNDLAPYIGLAQRANAVLYGEDIILERIKLAGVVLIDSRASDKYKERLKREITACPLFIADGLREALHRDGVNAVAVTNVGLANAIIEILR